MALILSYKSGMQIWIKDTELIIQIMRIKYIRHTFD